MQTISLRLVVMTSFRVIQATPICHLAYFSSEIQSSSKQCCKELDESYLFELSWQIARLITTELHNYRTQLSMSSWAKYRNSGFWSSDLFYVFYIWWQVITADYGALHYPTDWLHTIFLKVPRLILTVTLIMEIDSTISLYIETI